MEPVGYKVKTLIRHLIPKYKLIDIKVFSETPKGRRRLSDYHPAALAGLAVVMTVILVSFLWYELSLTPILARQSLERAAYISAPRGLIFDRQGNLLVENLPFYFYKNRWRSYQDIIMDSNKDQPWLIDPDRITNNLPVRYKRYYRFDPDAAGVVGYVSPALDSELISYTCSLDRLDSYCLTRDSYVGRSGVEQGWEVQLQGKPGAKLGQIWFKKPVSGQNLTLTLDIKLQSFIFDLLSRSTSNPAAVIVLNNKGEILSLVSLPVFEANVMSGGRQLSPANRQTEISRILDDAAKPLVNRVYQGVYPPGSVFKMVLAAAGLEEAVIDEDTLIEDTGFIKIGRFTFRNWYWTKYGKTEGNLNLVRALARSNDVFFYRLGERLGPEKIADYADRFGFGRPVDFGLPGEAAGRVPTPFWKQQTKGEAWFLGNTYHLSIGQGDLLVTPMQVAKMTLALATRGRVTQPFLVLDQKPDPEPIELKPRTWELVREGMRQACLKGGTAFVFFDFPVSVGCKTGTAEVDGENKQPHAWFTLFAPFDKPKYIITVLIETAGEGSYQAAPAAKQILEYLMREDGVLK